MGIFEHYQQRYEKAREEEYSIQEFLDMCKQDKSCYASAAERLLVAIGEPEMIDTSVNPRLSRLFSNRVVARYPAFKDFYGMEEAIEQIVSYLKHSAQGLEEKKQIPLSARPRWRRQIFAGRETQVPDAKSAHLSHQRIAGQRPPLLPVRHRGGRRDPGKEYGIHAAT